MEQAITIYVLLDNEGIPFYVGKTKYPKARLNRHKHSFGFLPVMVILETLPAHGNWRDCEAKWIETYRAMYPLKNISNGGSG